MFHQAVPLAMAAKRVTKSCDGTVIEEHGPVAPRGNAESAVSSQLGKVTIGVACPDAATTSNRSAFRGSFFRPEGLQAAIVWHQMLKPSPHTRLGQARKESGRRDCASIHRLLHV